MRITPRRRRPGFMTAAALALAAACPFAPAPAAIAAGTISGTVTFTGPVPEPKQFELAKFPNTEFCRKHPATSEDGTHRLLEEVRVAPNGGLRDAIVAVRDLTDKAWIESFDQTSHAAELCAWEPFTGIVVNLAHFHVENHDANPNNPKSKEGVLHNPHAFDVLGARSSTLFNVALAKKGDTLRKKLKMRMARKGSVMRLQCDQHEFMQAWFLPVQNPHYAKVDHTGAFTIEGVPAGEHQILAWHPVAGDIERTVQVTDGQTTSVELTIQ